jgi:hypothetical protein
MVHLVLARLALYTPEIVRISARWRPKTSSSASEISPTVALARAASTASASRLPSPARPAFGQRGERRLARRPRRARPQRSSLAICGAHRGVVDLEHVDLLLLLDRVELVDADDRLRPESMRACVRAAASSMRSLGMPASMALAMPPSASTSSMCSHARRRGRGSGARRSTSRPTGR